MESTIFNLTSSRPNLFMSTPQPTCHSSPFEHIHFVMIAPSHPGNVGAAARAIKTMGFGRLVLVDVKPSIITHPDAIAMASGATDVLDRALMTADLGTALAPIHLSFALSARTRYLGPPACHIRTAAKIAAQNIQEHDARIALVVGTERMGMTNEQTMHCNYLCHIPANEQYSSLNVAQALQIAAWEFRYALLDGDQAPDQLLPNAIKGKKHRRARPADTIQVDALLTHWREALTALEIIKADEPKRIPERMAHFFRRFQMREDEVSLFRGVCSAILKLHAKAQKKN